MISLVDAEPLDEAVRKMNARTPVARALKSAEWADVPLAIRERAFFTAQFARADVLQEMHDYLGKRIGLEAVPSGRGEVLASRSDFVRQMRQRLIDGGYVPRPGKEDTLQDMTSRGRLGLIFDINTQSAQEFARWKAGNQALDAFPAQELYREEGRRVPRNWTERWRAAGGEFFGGRMIALKTDGVWHKINRFGVPWPPFDFGSGMGVRDVSREEAAEIGLLSLDESLPESAPEENLNARLEKSVERYSPDVLAQILEAFAGRAVVEGDVCKWIGGGDPVARAAVGRAGTWKLLGLRPAAEIPPDDAPPKSAVEAAREKLSAPYLVRTVMGDQTEFGPDVLEHWEEKGKTELDKENRLRFLAAAEDAVRFAHEVWENERTGTRTYVHVAKDETKARVLHAWELRGSKIESFISTSDVERRGDKHREGRLVYAR